MAGHVFVSYSRDDSLYVRDLVAFLRKARLRVWVDEEIDYGDRWENEIRDRIDTCAAFVAVMTRSSENSPWVSREILRAEARGRPIVPLLLGGEVFFRLADLQFEDVRNRRMPGEGFIARLRGLAGVEPEPTPPPVFTPAPPRPPVEPTETAPSPGAAGPRPPHEPTAIRPDRPPSSRRRTLVAAVSAAVAVVLAISVAFIWNNLGNGTPTGGPSATGTARPLAGVDIDADGRVKGAAPQIPDAVEGGTVTVPLYSAFEDQAAMYSNDLMAVSRLMHRTLTAYIEDPKGGFPRIVGDLATNAGTVSSDRLTWTYKLRDDLKFDDGTPITSYDVGYGIARSFSKVGDYGPVFYLRDVLDPTGSYQGPVGGPPLPPRVETPDARTIVFKLVKQLPTLPFVLTMPFTAPVPRGKGNGADYATDWVSSGPYKLASYGTKTIRLVRSENWDKNTDPIRHAYADSFVLKPNLAQDEQYQAFVDDRTNSTVTTIRLTPDQVTRVTGSGALKARMLTATSNWMRLLSINTERVTATNVRRALNYAINRDAVVAALGGSSLAEPTTTIVPATVPGYGKLTRYEVGAKGDVVRAKELLDGAKPSLKLCYRGSDRSILVVRAITQAFEPAGVTATPAALTVSQYSDLFQGKPTDCDLVYGGWAPDFPDASSIMGPLFDGTSTSNISRLKVAEVTERLGELATTPNRISAADEYAHLADSIMDVYAPVIPLATERVVLLGGGSVHNAHISATYGQVDLTAIYVK